MTLQAPSVRIRAGCAFFDDVNDPGEGWCSINESTPVRFSSISSLPDVAPDAFWVTNCNPTIFDSAGLSNASYLRKGAFTKTSLSAILFELGFSAATMDSREAVQAASGVIARSWNIIQDAFPNILPMKTAAESVYRHGGFFDKYDPIMEPALQAAYQNESAVPMAKWDLSMVSAKLIANRVTHAHKILSMPFPAGEIKHVNRKLTTKDVILSDKAMIVQAEVRMNGSKYADLLATGVTSPRRDGKTLRQWFYSPELVMLAEFAGEITIKDAYEWEGMIFPPGLPQKFVEDDLLSLSYSAGLAAESIAYALSNKQYYARKRTWHHPARAGWFSAIDRVLTFALARRLFDCGARISRYSSGTVTLLAMDHEIPELAIIAADCGFQFFSTPSSKGGTLC